MHSTCSPSHAVTPSTSPMGGCSAPAPTLGPPGAPKGAPSKSYGQRWHPQPACVSDEKSAESTTQPASGTAGSRSGKVPYPASRVSGWGPQAQAALVTELWECGDKDVAASVAKCGAHALPFAEYVEVVSHGNNKRHMTSLCHCGKFQMCPTCTPYLMGRRLGALVPLAERLAADPDLRFFMVVLSARHYLGAQWKPLVGALRKMMAAIRQGHIWREVGEGYIRLLETTYGRNGHHPHQHVLLTLRVPSGWNPEPFFAWVQKLCERQAKKAGRTCAFQGDWWSEVDRDNLVKAIQYFASQDKMGTAAGPALLELNTTTKHQPTWCIPGKAYAEVYRDSYRLRWFAVGGCWKTKETAKSDEELEQERASVGKEKIAHIRSELYRSWKARERRDRRAVIYDRALTDGQVTDYVVACGGGAGPAPLPDWGDAG